MRRDLIIGIAISLAIHVGLAFSGKAPPPKPKPKDTTPTIAIVEMPKIEPDDPEPLPPDEQQPKPAEFAPPMLTDVPALVTDTSFVQKLAPPPPEGLRPNAAVFTIPENRNVGIGKGMEIFDYSRLDKVPEIRYRADVPYPFEMRRQGISGEVTVEFIVDSNGAVNGAFAVKSTHREFEANAVASVMKWKFTPGQKGGRKVNTRMQVPIVFTLNDN
jgi:periplasmic protein TonB